MVSQSRKPRTGNLISLAKKNLNHCWWLEILVFAKHKWISSHRNTRYLQKCSILREGGSVLTDQHFPSYFQDIIIAIVNPQKIFRDKYNYHQHQIFELHRKLISCVQELYLWFLCINPRPHMVYLATYTVY